MAWHRQRLLLTAAPWAASHAALPVARASRDTTEIYFSSRDGNGRSHIARAFLPPDLDGEPQFEAQPVLAPGELGAFDDAGVTTGCIVDDGDVVHLYYSGWTRGETVPFYFYVGLARSTDSGRTFTRASKGPVLERSDVDPFLTASPWILVEDDVWRMWYVSGTEWDLQGGRPRHRYHIKYAESRDGLNWKRDGHVCIDYRDDDEHAIARPTVVRDGDLYRMWYCSRGDVYRLGYADSPDGLEWERRDDEAGLELAEQGWDSEMICYPALYEHAGARYLLYNGNGYGASGAGYAVAGP